MFAIATPAKTDTGWKRVPDTKFLLESSAEEYGLKYHTTKDGSRLFKVIPHPDAA